MATKPKEKAPAKTLTEISKEKVSILETGVYKVIEDIQKSAGGSVTVQEVVAALTKATYFYNEIALKKQREDLEANALKAPLAKA